MIIDKVQKTTMSVINNALAMGLLFKALNERLKKLEKGGCRHENNIDKK